MISSQILQNTIDGLKNITRREFSVVDREGKVVSATEDFMLSKKIEDVDLFINSPAENQLVQGYQYFKVFDNNSVEYIVLTKGEDDESYQIGKIATFQIQNLLVAYKERYDKSNFIKNLLLDNLLLVDIYSRAKKLYIENNVKRVVYLIEVPCDKILTAPEIVRNLFSLKNKDFVTVVDESGLILVKELKEKENSKNIEEYANKIYKALVKEIGSKVYVSVGSVVYDLKNISSSYKEAKMALEVMKIFNSNEHIIKYEKLGIGRLIYQLPKNLCVMFLDEVLGGVSVDQFDQETLTTVNKFFENNLNVSETSRQLYIHRNTLVYRLDKLEKITVLDLRNFYDAIIFKIMLMVIKYMEYKYNYLN